MAFRWSLNPYMGCVHRCTFCYVRGFERRADRPSGEAYGTSIRVKTNLAHVLTAELARRTWRRDLVAIGTATDPYQPAEGRYRLTRACLEVFVRYRTPVSIITRGPLIVRDIDLLGDIARAAGASVSVSIPSLDTEVWRRTEPGTAPPAKRLLAVSRLVAAGIKAGVSIAPVLPGLSDSSESIEWVIRSARDAGAAHLWCSPLNLKPGTREHFLEALARDWPALVPRYERLYGDGPYLARLAADPILSTFDALRKRYELPGREFLAPPPAPRQMELAVS